MQSISPGDQASSETLWQEQQDTFYDDRGNKELRELRDKVRQLKETLAESNLEAGTYRERTETLQSECASLKRENDELKEKVRDWEETLQDVLERMASTLGHI